MITLSTSTVLRNKLTVDNVLYVATQNNDKSISIKETASALTLGLYDTSVSLQE